MQVYTDGNHVAPPAPGIYHKVPFETYARWNAMNASALVWGLDSMEHLQAKLAGDMEESKEESPDLRFGRAWHMAVLEPDIYQQSWVISSGCCQPLKSGKNKGAPCGNAARFRAGDSWYCGTHAPPDASEPSNYLTSEEAARVKKAAKKIKGHKIVNLIRQHGGFESTIVWEWNGIPCKSRFDKLIYDAACPDTILDLKKVQLGKCTNDDVSKSIANFKYHFKMAFYQRAVRHWRGADSPLPAAVLVFMEDKAPHSVNVKSLGSRSLDIGAYEVERLMTNYVDCCASGVWPGCSFDELKGKEDIGVIEVPEWELRKYNSVIS